VAIKPQIKFYRTREGKMNLVQFLLNINNVLANVWSIQATERWKHKNTSAKFDRLFDALDLHINLMNYSIGQDLSQCNKSIVIGTEAELKKFLFEQVTNREGMYLGHDAFLPHSRAWVMSPMQWDSQDVIHRQFQSVIHSGIFHHLLNRNESRRARPLLLLSSNLPSSLQALNVQSNIIASSFILFCILTISGILTLIFEQARRLLHRLGESK
jgi:hypothetical protein